MRNFLIACGMLLCAALGLAQPAAAQAEPMGVKPMCWSGTAWVPCQLNPNLGIGNVGGFEFDKDVTPTIQNAAYVAGNALGGLQTVSVFRTAGGSAKLNNISLWSKGGATVNVTFYIFTSNPTSSTCTDKAAFSLNAADVAKLIATTPPVLTPHVVGSGTTDTADAWQSPVSMSNGDSTTNIYVCLVAGGSVTPATTTDYVFKVSGPRD
jgi:hypothetical protein